MTRTIRTTVAVLVTLALAVGFSACSSSANKAAKNQQKSEAAFTAKVNKSVRAKVGFPHVQDSLELRNLKKRYETLDDPNATGYVYLVSHGLIISEYTVKGKVSSLNSQFTNDDQIIDNCDGSCSGSVIRQAEPDGSYGDNPAGVFFWTTDGVYVEWAGDYLYSDRRLEIQQPTQNIIAKQAP